MIVIAILAILAAVVIFALNPAELFRRARDSQRMSDLRVLSSALSYYLADVTTPVLDGSGNTLCSNGSGTDTIFATSANTTLPTGWGAWVASTNRTVAGAGWLKVNFTTGGAGTSPIGQLPIDPSNSGITATPSTMYTFGCHTSLAFELDANMESTNYKSLESADGGDLAEVYEMGTQIIGLLPATTTNFYTNH